MPDGRASVRLPPRYRILHHLADGGMATVWAAQDDLLDRRVAVKVLAPGYAADPAARRRFAREARAAARLSSHPHVVTIFDIGDADDQAFIVMELLAGGTVRDRLRSAPVDEDIALRWLGEAAAALDAAHAKDIVHRDVKPANLLLDEHGRLAVGDFGIASLAGESAVTQTGQVLGTAAYLSPEQARGEPATPASDRYALALVAHELLRGHRPLGGDVQLHGALARGLEQDPARRPRSAGAFVQELRAEHDREERTVVARRRPREDPPREERFTRELTPRQAAVHREAPRPRGADARGPAAGAPGAGRPADDGGGSPGRGRRRVAPLAALVALLLAGGGVAAVLLTQGGDQGGRAQAPTRTTNGGGVATGDDGARAADDGAAAGDDSAATGDEGAPTTSGGAGDEGAPTTSGGGATPGEERPPATQTTTPPARDGRSPSELNDAAFALLPGDPGQAIPLLERAVTDFRSSGQTGELGYAYALYNLGWALRLAGRPAEAIPYLTERLQVSSNQRAVVRAELREARRAAGA